MGISEQIQGLKLKAGTKLVGILGHNIQYSLSPAMHNFAFEKLGLDYKYVLFDVDPKGLKSATDELRKAGAAGLNVTIPHKESILGFLSDAAEDAKKVRAVNTVVVRDGKWFGENTDLPGFLENLREDEGFEPKGKKAVVLGAGGTAKALSYALLKAGVRELAILNRTPDKASQAARQFQGWFKGTNLKAMELNAANIRSELEGCDLFVSTSPNGLDDFAEAASEFRKSLPPKALFFDAVYARPTGLFKAAQESGARCVNGLGLLVRQGAMSFSLWTGQKPPVALMKEALKNANA